MSLFDSLFDPSQRDSDEFFLPRTSIARVPILNTGIFGSRESPKVILYKEDGSEIGTIDLELASYSDSDVRAKLLELKPTLHIYAYKVVGESSGHPFAGQIVVL